MKNTPYWWEDAGAPAVPPQAALPREVDFLVIGGGLTGLSAARTAAMRGRSVLVLEAGAPGIGASGRNGGMVGGGHRVSPAELDARYGREVADGLLREAYVDSLAFVRGVMAEDGIDCDFRPVGRFQAFWRGTEVETARRTVGTLATRIGYELKVLDRGQVHHEVATDAYRGGMVFADHGSVNPAKWVRGLLDAAKARGAQVEGDTPVLGVAREASAFRVTTARGTVRARAVLAATNGYSGAALPQARRRIIPVPSFIVATEELGENRMRALIPNGRNIVETRNRHSYFRPSPDGKRLVWGARAAMFEVGETFATAQLRKLVEEVFPDLRGVGFTHSWRGRTGFSFGFQPAIRQIDGIWYAMGYSGNGNTMAPWLGHKAALRAIGEPDPPSAFEHTAFDTRFWHRGPAWFLPFVDIGFRYADIRNRFGR